MRTGPALGRVGPRPAPPYAFWTSATGGPREWIFTALASLEQLLAVECNRQSTVDIVKQACNIDDFVFTSKLKDANGKQGSRKAFLAFLSGQPVQFYDGLHSTLAQSPWIIDDFTPFGGPKVRDDFIGAVPADAATVIYNKRIPPDIPPMITFFRPGAISKELLGVVGPRDEDNIAMVFHEGLHAYTRRPDLFADGALKNRLGCNTNELGTYDITAFLMQFTKRAAPTQAVKPCTEFSGQRPRDPIQ